MKKKFNPQQWLDYEAPNNNCSTVSSPKLGEVAAGRRGTEPNTNELQLQTESIIQQIENQQIDITAAYSDWRNIGFAFADEFGETGSEYFHRISKFYPDYSATECDRQFDNCLKAKGQGISLKTFFYHAKQAGVSISRQLMKVKHRNKFPFSPNPYFLNFPIS